MQAHRFPLLRTHFVVIPFDAPLLPFAFGARFFPMDFLWFGCFCGVCSRVVAVRFCGECIVRPQHAAAH